MTPPAYVRWIIYFLQFIAICQMLAFIAVSVPVESWLAGWYAWLALGDPPEVSAILRYVVGATVFFQGAVGIWLWVMLSDMARHRALLIATAIICLIAAPVFYFIDASAGLPLLWRLYDSIWCLIVGAALVALCRWISRTELCRGDIFAATEESFHLCNAAGDSQNILLYLVPLPYGASSARVLTARFSRTND